ncbi:MAG TPA: maleylpyruvate isomerase N-terminal domain-containing protein, partial [Streptosporangiaceae bacterium]|nr:maleylpyruvate isomerase N-terminal domain-containing protein [Streptosporangiaceae bacterium]
MTGRRAAEAGLLEPAIGYALDAIQAVTPDLMSRATPCRAWDLRMLLRHASESLAALCEGACGGRVDLRPAAEDATADPVRIFRDRAGLLLRAWTSTTSPPEVIAIADRCLPHGILAAAGALEIAVHGWDVSQACGHCRPIPPLLAADLLEVAPLLVPALGRHPLFAAPVAVAPMAGPSDRL